MTSLHKMAWKNYGKKGAVYGDADTLSLGISLNRNNVVQIDRVSKVNRENRLVSKTTRIGPE